MEWSALGVVSAAAVQTLLIVWLLVERRRRRHEARIQLLTITHLDRRAAIGEVTSAITHQLNQPLEAILHNAEAGELMLESGTGSTDDLRSIFADIRRIDLRTAEMIHRLRGLLEKKELESRPVDVNDLCHETASLVAPVARSKNVRVELELSAEGTSVIGDHVHLQQVLLNVLLNGIESMHATPRECRRLAITTTHAGDHVEISIRDAGHGIRAETTSRIFEPFYTTKGEGMGVGLSIGRTIVEAHGGRIGARNNDGEGATVWFTLPSCEPAPGRAAPRHAAADGPAWP